MSLKDTKKNRLLLTDMNDDDDDAYNQIYKT